MFCHWQILVSNKWLLQAIYSSLIWSAEKQFQYKFVVVTSYEHVSIGNEEHKVYVWILNCVALVLSAIAKDSDSIIVKTVSPFVCWLFKSFAVSLYENEL